MEWQETKSNPQIKIGVGFTRKWQRRPVFLPGELHGQRSLQATAHGIAKNWPDLATDTFTFQSVVTFRWLLWLSYLVLGAQSCVRRSVLSEALVKRNSLGPPTPYLATHGCRAQLLTRSRWLQKYFRYLPKLGPPPLRIFTAPRAGPSASF